MKRLLIAGCLSALAFATTAAASPGIGSGPFVVGATEDGPQWAVDGGATIFAQMHTYGLGAIRMSVFWDGGAFYTPELGLKKAVAEAALTGVRPLISIAPAGGHANAFSQPESASNMARFAVQVAQAFPEVQDIIIGNEPNLQRFNSPSWNGSVPVGAWNYEKVLAAGYDALKAFNPNLDVVGVPTSPRGNLPGATSNVAIPPVKFIKGVGDAFKASARAKPVADNVGLHPYPNPNSAADAPAKGYQWPNAGAPNLDRLQQAWWDGFNGTAQPMFAEDGLHTAASGRTVKWILDEAGWQVPTTLPGYSGSENWKTVSEATQAKYYAEMTRMMHCDSTRVAGLLFFHWQDESNRASGFQSGFARLDGSVRPAASAVRSALDAGCSSRAIWNHITSVEGAHATFARAQGFLFSFRAEEDTRYVATVSVAGRTIARAAGDLTAYWTGGVKPGAVRIPRGATATVTLTSVMNPARRSTFTHPLG